MEEQNLVLKNVKSFNLTHIFECGQCFRWNKNEDGSYTGIVKKNVINLRMVDSDIYVTSFGEDDINKLFQSYFDMQRNYESIKAQLSEVDEHMKKSILYGDGIRLLNQDLWETIISFIISANNNIPRIKGIIERMCKRFGNSIEYNGQVYYSFPTPEQLGSASVEDLRNLGLGFRDVRVYETTQKILNKEIDLEKLHEESSTEIVREKLMNLPGVGPKVADCILLFSTLKRFNVFPVDVWVRRVMNELYVHNEFEEKVSKKEIYRIANEKFGDLCGIAQQYLFYWKRG